MHALRRLIGRAQPTEMEIKLLLGLARQIHWQAIRADRSPMPDLDEQGLGGTP
jgi:tRNA C32,U32 (ribose-2'-O)-methylase TrmJ